MRTPTLYRVSFKETRCFTVAVQACDDVEAIQRVAADYRANRSPNEWEREAMRGVAAVHWDRIERVGEPVPCEAD